MTMTKTNTTMCIGNAELDYFGCSTGPVAIHDGSDPLLNILGRSDGPVNRGRLTFGGVEFTTHRIPGSLWLLLNAEVGQ